MSFGFQKKSSGSFNPFIKYDAKAGRWGAKRGDDIVDVTQGFNAVFDIGGCQLGWLIFANGQGPQEVLQHNSMGFPPQPAGDKWQQGFKCLVALPPSLGGGIYDWSSNASVTTEAFDEMHSAYMEGAAQHPGKLPVFAMTGVKAIKGAKATNYKPLMELKAWVDRPASMAAQATGDTLPPSALPPVDKAPSPTAPAFSNDFG